LSEAESKKSSGQAQTGEVAADRKNPAEPETDTNFRSAHVRMMQVPLAGERPRVLFEEPGINTFSARLSAVAGMSFQQVREGRDGVFQV
jgi:hypothetical protein